MRVWITGGYFDQSGECFVDEIDLGTGTRKRLLGFVPPSEFCVPTKGFTGARWLDPHTLLVASFCAVWRFDVRTWAPTGALHQPDFNDLHDVHVDHAHDRLYVCNTGLDAVEVFDLEGRFLGRSSLSPAWFDERRQNGEAVERTRFADLMDVGWTHRLQQALAPASGGYYSEPADPPEFHRRVVRDYTHPNHVAIINGRLAVTLLGTQEVRCLHTFQTLASFEGHPHDGHVHDGLAWTTTTNGGICAWDPSVPGGWRRVEHYDTSTTGHVGWCRGLLPSTEGLAVAITRMQGASQYPWRADPVDRTETSVLWIERGSGKLLGHVEITDDRRPKIFAILPTSMPARST